MLSLPRGAYSGCANVRLASAEWAFPVDVERFPYQAGSIFLGAFPYEDAWRKLKFDILAIGDDWFGRPDYVAYEAELAAVGVKVVYIPYTDRVSSTCLKAIVGSGAPGADERG